MRKEFESVDWNKERGNIVITKQETIGINNAKNIKEVKKILKKRIRDRVQQIKVLKNAALKDKMLLEKLEGKAGSSDPAQSE